MAFLCQRCLLHSNRSNYHHSLNFLRSISTLEISTPISQSNNLQESHVLNELSSLLPITSNHSNPNSSQIRAQTLTGNLLLPEERLRGVFLEKLKGNFFIEQALNDVGVELNIDIVSNVLNRGNLSAESMITFFNWAIKQPSLMNDASSYNVILKALGRRKYVDFVVKLLRELREQCVELNLETLSIVMDSLLRARRVYKAIEIFGNHDEFGFQWNTESLNVVLHCLCKRSHVGAAHWYLNSVKGKIPFDHETYNVVLGGWSKFGRVSEMEKVLEAMVDDGFDPDCSTFSYLIEGLGRADRIEDSIRVFDSMLEKNYVPDTTVYNAMISNFVSVRDFDGCMKYYKHLLSSNSEPTIDTYSKLISAFIKARKVADALEMFDEMLSKGIVPATGNVTSFIEPLCSFGPPFAAIMIYRKAKRAGCNLSLSAYKLLLMRLSRFGKCGMLLNLWNEMQESGYSSDMEVYESVINGLCNNGQLENAALVMEESMSNGFCPSRLIYSKLTNKLMESNKVETAYRLFLKIKGARRNENAQSFWRSKGWHF